MRSLHHIYSIWFLTWIEFVKPHIEIIFLQFTLNTIISRIHSVLLLYLNGTILIVKLETREVSQFLKNLLNLIRPCSNSIFNIHNPYRIKLLTRLRLGLSHLYDHKFRHCFQDTRNPLCDVVMILKQQHTFFSTAQVSRLLDKPSWAILEISTNRFYLMAKIS